MFINQISKDENKFNDNNSNISNNNVSMSADKENEPIVSSNVNNNSNINNSLIWY